jgi:hypothetical protein
VTKRGAGRDGKAQPQKVTFGQVAVRKGFASRKQVDEALRIQRALHEQTGKHKLIGLVMLEMGILGTTELISVLKELSRMPSAPAAVVAQGAARASSRRKPGRS